MKITFLSPPPNLSGGQRVIAIHANHLSERGHDVTVVARGRARRSRRNEFRNLIKGLNSPSPPKETHFDQLTAKLVVLPHSDPITTDDVPDADVIIATWWETAFDTVHLPPEKGRKFYFIQHHEVHSHLPAHISGASYLLPLKKITISNWLVDLMRTKYGDENVGLVPNSVDCRQFFAPERNRQLRPTVGFLYSTTHFKGVDISLRAIEIARRTHPDLRVIAFGTDRPKKELALPDGAEFYERPKQDTLRTIYGACDVWLCGSRAEGFHLPPAEAMACRCPVVSTKVGGPVDMITNGKEGFLVDVEDHVTLGSRLAEVLSMDDRSWRAMSDAAYERARCYTWNEATQLLESYLQEP